MPDEVKEKQKIDLSFIVTRECNKRCDHCYLELGEEIMDFATFTDRLDRILEAYDISSICLSGGEPLTYPHIFDMIRYIGARRDCDIDLSTNGILLAPDTVQELKKHNVKIYVTYNEHDVMVLEHSRGAFQEGMEINVYHFLTSVSRGSIEGIMQNMNFAKRMIFIYPTDVGKGNVMMPSPDEWFSLLHDILNVACDRGIEIFYEVGYMKKDELTANSVICPSGADIIVNTDGTIAPCCLLLDHKVESPGLMPYKRQPTDCEFLQRNPVDEKSDYIRVCPLYYRNVTKGEFVKPGLLDRQGGD